MELLIVGVRTSAAFMAPYSHSASSAGSRPSGRFSVYFQRSLDRKWALMVTSHER